MTPEQIDQLDMQGVKERLSISFVLSTYGLSPAAQDGRSLSYHSPFREDEHPSLDVFRQSINGRPPEERYGDRTEGTNGDVIDLIMRFEDFTTGQAITRAMDLLKRQYATDWEGPVIAEPTREPLDHQRIARLQEEAIHPGFSPLWTALVEEKPGLDGTLGDEYCAYHPGLERLMWFLRDRDGELVTVRYRTPDGSKYAEKGRPNTLIRFMKEDQDLPVLFTEGETDTAAATMHLAAQFQVVGQPGNDYSPDKTEGEFAGRTCYIAFDPDTSGQRAARAWAAYLSQQGCPVFIITLAEGQDIASLEPARIRKLKQAGQRQTSHPDGFIPRGQIYYRIVGDKETEMSNFALTPIKRLDGDDGSTAWQVTTDNQPEPIVLPIQALNTTSTFQAWGNQYGLVWYGNNSQLQLLKAWLTAEGAYLPAGKVANQVGLHDGTFVWGHGKVGGTDYGYAPTGAERHGKDRIFIKRGGVSRTPVDTFKALYESQDPAVTGPFLAWMAAAPLRTRFRQFPILAVTGVSGTGKTALTGAMLREFTGTEITTNLTSTTPYGIESILDSSNAFPIWIDEYRPGARRDTKAKVDQLIRDAYTRQISSKGNVRDSSLVVDMTRTDAPLVITGEESFQERSHLERMVSLRLQRAGQQDLPTPGEPGVFAERYLRFLQARSRRDAVEPPVFQTYPDLARTEHAYGPRESHNLHVLRVGWDLLDEFLGIEMPEFNLDQVGLAYIDAAHSTPIIDLILAVLEDERNKDACVYERGNDILISTSGLAKVAKDYPIVLPSETSKGLKATLMDELGAEDIGQQSWPGYSGSSRRVRSVRIKPSALGRNHESESHAAD